MQKLLITWARLCDKSKFYDSFSYQSSIVFPLILTCNISFENGLKSQIQWYNNQNNQIKTIEMTKLWTNLPSNHLKPQMYDSVSFSRTLSTFCQFSLFLFFPLNMREFQLEVKFHSAAYLSVFLTFLWIPMSPVGSLRTYSTTLSHRSQVISTVSTFYAWKWVKNVENRWKIVKKTLWCLE